MKENTLSGIQEKNIKPDIAREGEITREKERYIPPAVDIYETDENLVVVADMPGVEKDTVEAKVDDNVLTLKAMAKSETKGETFYKEYDIINYFRQFELSEDIDQENIKGELKQGVLTLTIPMIKKPEPKKVDIRIA